MKKKLLIALFATAMLTLAACGKKEPAETKTETSTDTVAEVAAEPELSPEEKYPATISPYDIHPGSLNSDEDTSDRWYPDGDVNAEYAFTLTQTSVREDCVGLAFCLYKVENGNDSDMCDVRLRDGGNGHAVTNEFQLMADKSQTFDFDLTFQDNFTCYDFKSGKVWKRCHPDYGCKDQAWYDKAFAGLVAYRDLAGGKYQQIVMKEDGTFVESVTGMDDMNGRWIVKAANVLDLVYDNPEDSGVQVIDGGSLLEDGGESGKETTYSDTWQQEFNISADGKVTEFGLFPKYDDDMNLTGYAAAFEVTTVAEMEAKAKAEADAAEAEKAAAEKAKADALAAGSPYEEPEDRNDLSGVNLDQEPDFVLDGTQDYATFDKIKKDMGKEYGMIFELHGEVVVSGSFASVKVQNESGRLEQKFTVVIVDGDDILSVAGDGEKIAVKGVLWSNRKLYTDSAHVKAE